MALLADSSPEIEYLGDVLLYPIYVRGSAHLAAGLGKQAEAEFQKILDHRGLSGNYLLGALAQLGLGRAFAIEGGVTKSHAGELSAKGDGNAGERSDALVKSRSAYAKFFTIWSSADENLPLLTKVRMEFRAIQQGN